MANKVCLIYTGGTIGMVRDRRGELRPPAHPEDFLRVAPELESIVEFDFVPLMNKDSTNMNHHDWSVIAAAVHSRAKLGYRGFVIAHGTDTMHFTASALAFALGSDLPCPVVLTGSQTIPEVHHGDARINLVRACRVALEDLGEVVISFGDYVFRGCRAQKKDEARFDAFESPAEFPLGFITEEIKLNPGAKGRNSSRRLAPFRGQFSGGILQVSLIPGLRPDLAIPAIESDACQAVILQSFGAGNVPDDGEYSFLSLIKRCVDWDKPVIVTSQFPARPTLHTSYAPGRRAVEVGAIPTSNMTASCATVKLRWALAHTKNGKDRSSQIRRVMSKVYVGEMDPIESHRGRAKLKESGQ